MLYFITVPIVCWLYAIIQLISDLFELNLRFELLFCGFPRLLCVNNHVIFSVMIWISAWYKSLASHCLCHLLSEIVFILPLCLKNVFVGCRMVGWQFITLCHCLLTSKFLTNQKIFGSVFFFFCIWVMYLHSLAFKTFFLWFSVFWGWCAYSFYAHPLLGFTEYVDSVNEIFE